MPWFKITIALDNNNTGLSAEIQNEFDVLFVKANSPKDAALYSKRPSPDTIELYFSPASSRFACGLVANHGGIACEKPFGEVLLVVGNPDRNLTDPHTTNHAQIVAFSSSMPFIFVVINQRERTFDQRGRN